MELSMERPYNLALRFLLKDLHLCSKMNESYGFGTKRIEFSNRIFIFG